MKKIYIAGPMRGYAGWNFRAFDEAKKECKDRGYWPISPADLDRAFGPTLPDSDEVCPAFLCKALSRDLAAILHECDAMLLLDGWKGSDGAQIEAALAQVIGLEVFIQPWTPIALSFFTAALLPMPEECDV